MNIGDIVRYANGYWSTFGYTNELGLLIKEYNLAGMDGYPEAEYSKVLWFKDGTLKLVKSKHLEVVIAK